MTVFISHARADQAVADSLEGLLERRGHFVELDNGEVALEPVAAHDIVVALVSQAFAIAEEKLRLTQRALDAWSAGRLILVTLDETPPPIGLRDLPAIDASVVETRDLVWVDVATAIQKASAAAPLAGRRPGKGGGLAAGVLRVLVTLALMAPGMFAIAATGSIWLANRIGPRPGGMAELLAGIDAFGNYYNLPSGATVWLFAAAILLLLGVLARFAMRLLHVRLPHSHPRASGSGVFISAADSDSARVATLIAAAESAGAPSLPPQNLSEADNAAAIASAETVLVMCSPAAYQSDQVKRDLYLAERSGKRVVPVFLDAAPPPADFAFFFAGQTGLALHAQSETEQARALAQALGAPASAGKATAPQE